MRKEFSESFEGFEIKVFLEDRPQNPRRAPDAQIRGRLMLPRLHLPDGAPIGDGQELDELMGEKSVVWPVYAVQVEHEYRGKYFQLSMGVDDHPNSVLAGLIGMTEESAKGLLRDKSRGLDNHAKTQIALLLSDEIMLYNHFLSGEIYGYEVRNGSEVVHQCAGGVPGFEVSLEAAREAAVEHKNLIEAEIGSAQTHAGSLGLN